MASRNAKTTSTTSGEAEFSSEPSQRRTKETPRSIAYRVNKNAITKAAVKSELDIKLFKNLGGKEKFLQTVNFTAQERSIHLSCSSRGLGLLVNQAVLRTSQVYPNIEPPIPELYRTSLGQMEATMSVVCSAQHQMTLKPVNQPVRMQADLLDAIKSHPQQLSSVAAVINQIGNVVVNDTTFYPRMTTQDHFNLSLSNLRNYAERMSNVGTPLLDRQNGFLWNSIPSAVWGTDLNPDGTPNQSTLRMLNPDQVIEDDYGMQNLLTDFRRIEVYFERLSRKMTKSIDNVEFSDQGRPSQLVSTIVGPDPIRLNSSIDGDRIRLVSAVGDADEWYSQRSIEAQDSLMGIIGLTGEVVLQVPAHFIPPNEAFRSPHGAAQVFDQSWMSTVESMF